MEKYETLFDAVQPLLDEAHIEQWKPSEFDLFASLLTEYHRTCRSQWQQYEREMKKDGGETGAEAAPDALHAASSSSGADGDGHGHDHGHDHGHGHHHHAVDTSAFPYLPSQDEVAVVDRQLVKIKHYLNRTVPFGSVDEPTTVPTQVEKSEEKKETTPKDGAVAAVPPPVFSVDAFLLEEDDVVELVQEGKLQREYCQHCGSTQIGLTDFISHSFSRDQMVYISCFLLPFLNAHLLALQQPPIETMAEVGARFGGLLWASLEAKKVAHNAGEAGAATLLPFLKRVIGVELDHQMVELERTILKRFFTPSRPGGAPPLPLVCDLVESDCFQGDGAAALRAADVLVLHNVFEYFVKSPAEHLGCWQKLRETACRAGQLLVCAPSLEETFRGFDEATLQQHLGTAGRKRSRASEGKKGKEEDKSLSPLAAAWLASYVVPVDVTALRDTFVAFRIAHMTCGQEEEEGDAEPFVGELKEGVGNIFVYRVI